MGYIPPDAKWYLAEIVNQITAENQAGNVVHVNLVLVRAGSPEEAFAKATELGHDGQVSYQNPSGAQVRIQFRGLAALQVIHDPLEHGAELSFSEHLDLDEAAILQLIPARDHLQVFAPIQPAPRPFDYSSRDVTDEVRRRLINQSGTTATRKAAGRPAAHKNQ